MEEKSSIPPLYQKRVPLRARHPFKAIYTLIKVIGIVAVCMPVRAILYILPWRRPNPKWTWKQAMMVRLLKLTHTLLPSIRMEATAPLAPRSKEKEIYDLVQPVSADLLQGVLDQDKTSVRPVQRPGNWYPARYDPEIDADRKVLFYLHGGAYVIGYYQPGNYTDLLSRLLPALGDAKFFSVGPRLASSAGNHFPAQLLDALSGYQHLLNLGVNPSHIIVLGDSAGANLTLALLRYLVETEVAPLPAAALLACPWVDLSVDPEGWKKHRNYKYEIITKEILEWGVKAVVPANIPLTNAYISPALHPFKIPIPVWIDANSEEILYDQIITLADGLKAIEGNDVELHVTNDGTHDTFMWGVAMGFNSILDKSVASVGAFVEKRDL